MRYLIFLIALLGCDTVPFDETRYESLRTLMGTQQAEILAKQEATLTVLQENTDVLRTIKEAVAEPEVPLPVDPAGGAESPEDPPPPSKAASPAPPVLYVTYADTPSEEDMWLRAAIEEGQFAAFEIRVIPDSNWDKPYPILRWKTDTGWMHVTDGHGKPLPYRRTLPDLILAAMNPERVSISPVASVTTAPTEERWLVSETWCPHCPAAKARFLRSGGQPDHVITIAEARRRHGKNIGSIPVEYKTRSAGIPAQKRYRKQWPGTWSYNGDTTPDRSALLKHLRTDPNHAGKFWQVWPLEVWTVQELVALHDDDHTNRVRR